MQTYERKTPVAGIGFGQRGFWGNRHFSSVELARAAYAKHLAEMRNEAVPSGTAGRLCWHHGAIEQDKPITGNLIEAKSFTGRLKNGKPGKTKHTVHLYAIDPDMAARFLKDPFYAVEE